MLRNAIVTAAVVLGVAGSLEAQGTPRAPEPLPPPPPPVSAAQRTTPPDSAVALCADGSFIVAPDSAASRGARGGVRVRFAGPRVPPPPPAQGATDAASRSNSASLNAPPPPGATLRCKDGTYLSGPADVARCAQNGGSGIVLPRDPVPPPAPPTRTP
jgi:hypothetical protein